MSSIAEKVNRLVQYNREDSIFFFFFSITILEDKEVHNQMLIS